MKCFAHKDNIIGKIAIAAFLSVFYVGCRDPRPAPIRSDLIEEQVKEPVVGEEKIPSSVVGLETVVSSMMRVGDVLEVQCLLLGRDGRPVVSEVDLNPTIAVTPKSAFKRTTDNYIAIKPVRAQVQCMSANWGLLDPTPVDVRIIPGEVSHVRTLLSHEVVGSGQWVDGFCLGYDGYYNEVGEIENANLVSQLKGSGIQFDAAMAGRFRIFETGLHHVSCSVPGVDTVESATLSIVNGKAKHLNVSLSPGDGVWIDPGQDVLMDIKVFDSFGNRIVDVPIEVDVLPGCRPNSTALECGHEIRRNGNLIFYRPGEYQVIAKLDPLWAETNAVQGSTLEVRKEVRVRRDSPEVTCVGPKNHSMVEHPLGTSLDFRVELNHVEGLEKVQIRQRGGEWQEASSRGRNTYGAAVFPEYGFNYVEVQVLRDEALGGDSETQCVFMASEYWHEESDWMPHAASVKLAKNLFDNNANGLDSFGEIFRKIFRSDTLEVFIRNSLDELISSVPGQQFTIPGDVTDTLISLSVSFDRFELGDDRTVAFDLRGNELVMSVRLEDILLSLDLSAFVRDGLINVSDLRGNIRSFIGEIVMTNRYPIEFENGQVRLGQPRVDIETLGEDVDIAVDEHWAVDVYDFFASQSIDEMASGFSSAAVIAMQHTLNVQIESALQGLLSDSFSDLGLGLDFEGSGIQIPKVGGQGNIQIGYGLKANSVDVDPSGISIGLSDKITVTNPAHARRSLGTPSSRVLDGSQELPNGRSFSAGLNVDVINQVLHALWRGGMFDYSLASDDETVEEQEEEVEEELDPTWSNRFCGLPVYEDVVEGDACDPELPSVPGLIDTGDGDPVPYTISLVTALPPLITLENASFLAHTDELGRGVRSVPAGIELATEVMVSVPSFLDEPIQLMVAAKGRVRVGVREQDQARVVKLRRETGVRGEPQYFMDSNFVPGKRAAVQQRAWEKIDDSFQLDAVSDVASRRHEGDAALCVVEKELALYLGHLNVDPENIRVVPIGALGSDLSPEVFDLLEEVIAEFVTYGLEKVVKLQDCVNANSLFSLPIPRVEMFNQINFSTTTEFSFGEFEIDNDDVRGDIDLNGDPIDIELKYNMLRFDLPLASTLGPNRASLNIENGMVLIGGEASIQGISLR